MMRHSLASVAEGEWWGWFWKYWKNSKNGPAVAITMVCRCCNKDTLLGKADRNRNRRRVHSLSPRTLYGKNLIDLRQRRNGIWLAGFQPYHHRIRKDGFELHSSTLMTVRVHSFGYSAFNLLHIFQFPYNKWTLYFHLRKSNYPAYKLFHVFFISAKISSDWGFAELGEWSKLLVLKSQGSLLVLSFFKVT